MKLSKKEQMELKNHVRRKQLDEQMELEKCRILIKSTRAGKLLEKQKRFVVVAVDEPYFMNVYKMIRRNEMHKCTWTDQCEKDFRAAFGEWLEY